MSNMLFLALLIFMSVGIISPDKNDYEQFVLRWQIEGDLPCIHKHVHPSGPDPKAKSGEPNWKGRRTYCFFLQEEVSVAQIYEWPSFGQLLGIAFIRKISPGVGYVTEGDRISECQALTEIKTSLPTWTKSNDVSRINREIQNRCFYVKYDVGGPEPIKVVFKVTRMFNNKLEGKKIKYIVPKRPDYKIYERESGLNNICTRCQAGGGIAQPILISSSNMTDVLRQLKEKYTNNNG